MNENHAKPPPRRLVIICCIVAAVVIGFFALLPCARELGTRAVLGRDITMWSQVDSAVRVYHMQVGHYPVSLDAPDFQPYINESVTVFLREGRLTYHPPTADSPPTFILVHMTTPRGDYSAQLDGTRLYPNSK